MTVDNSVSGFCIGDILGLKSGRKIVGYYEIIAKDRNLLLSSAFSSVAAGATSGFTQITDLNPPNDLVYNITRLEIEQGNVKIQFRHPSSTSRFGTERNPDGGFITDHDDHVDFDVWAFENFPPSLNFNNDTNVGIVPVVRWHGWTYRIMSLGKVENVPRCHQITVGGICR